MEMLAAEVATWSTALAGLWLDYIWPIVMLVFGLGLVIFCHELGHFLVAKLVGIKVERFALGFGPRLFGVKSGETDYCVNLLPLGGYVKMLGQEDFKPLEEDEKPDPRSYMGKSVGARFAVISAGVIMNVVLAAVLFIVVCLAGIRFIAPVVGGASPGKPASRAEIQWLDQGEPKSSVGLEAGDRILQLNGAEVTDFSKIFVSAALSNPDDVHTMLIERTVNGQARKGLVKIGLTKTPGPSGADILAFGIERPSDSVLGKPEERLLAGPFQDGDRVVAIAGKAVNAYWDIEPIVETFTGQPVTVTVVRDDKRTDLTVQPSLWLVQNGVFLKDGTFVRGQVEDVENKPQVKIALKGSDQEQVLEESQIASRVSDERLDLLGLVPRLQVETVLANMPAQAAGVQPGDVVLSYGDRNSPTHRQFTDVSNGVGAKPIPLVVLRGGQNVKLTVTPTEVRSGVFQVGLSLVPDMTHLNVAGVREGSLAAKAGLLSGDVLSKVNGKKVDNWADVFEGLILAQKDDKPVALSFARGEQTLDAELGKVTRDRFAPGDYHCFLFDGMAFRPLMGPEVRKNPLQAIVWGVQETGDFILRTYLTLKSLLQRTVSTKEVMGPVGMASVAIDVGRDSFVRFIYFLAMISVSLAVINFLPFPVVDGGHAVFLLIEKLRGKPVPVKVMNVVQIIGIAMLLFVFVAVTWQDIMRLLRS